MEKDYKEHRAVNLSSNTLNDSKVLAELLYNNGYVSNRTDAQYIADTLSARVKRLTYSNLYDLQKRAYGQVPMVVADSAGVLTKKVQKSNEQIGLLDLKDSTLPAPNLHVLDMNSGDGEVAIIVHPVDNANVENVLVRVKAHYLQNDTVVSEVIGCVATDANGKAKVSGLDKAKGYSVLPIRRGYEYGREQGVRCGKFDENGLFRRKEHVFTFTQKEHRIQMIDNVVLKQIKHDGTLTVRTPSEFKSVVSRWFAFVILGWWVLCIFLMKRKKNFDPLLIAAAMFLTVFCVLMMFSIQNPLTEDLRGVEMAKGVLWGQLAVLLLQFVDFVKLYKDRYRVSFDIPLSCISWLFLPFKEKVAWVAPIFSGQYAWWKKTLALIPLLLCLPFGLLNLLRIEKLNGSVQGFFGKLPKGIGWLVVAVVMTMLLWTPLGQSIGGMKVNMRLGSFTFQPSEVVKYLILFFMASFFTQSADSIIAYSRPTKGPVVSQVWSKVKLMGWVIGGLVVLLGLYAALGDLGPALVVGITFVLLYSLVKSKVNLENLNEEDRWHRILTCDFAMLIYGMLSFAAFIVAGSLIGDSLIGALLWFVAWVAFGLLRRKQFFETAFIMNLLVFVFVFGGQIMQGIPPLAGTDIAERFDQRTKMCINTWGELDVEHGGANAEEVSNTQVANGLWALATGGLSGQGFGRGNPNLIPAFHTDMILSSIGEQTGWVGLFVVMLVLAVLLRRLVVVGYKAGHPFAFYFCMGVAIVTGVQFFIIALGSSGTIPLTGITVPFLSYGRVSMILNMLAIGIVLSISQNEAMALKNVVEQNVVRRTVGDYNYPVAIVSWTYVVLAAFTLGVWQYYCFWKRGETLAKPAFVYSSQGMPVIEYNPRISLLTKEMWAGNVYDRNGVLLASSDRSEIARRVDEYKRYGLSNVDAIAKGHSKRYYPFGEHLFFMLGDMNKGLFFSYNEYSPIGYMAEAQHLAYLRDYDNIMRDEHGNPVIVNLKDRTRPGGRFVSGNERGTTVRYVVRDNSELVKYLKDGLHGRALEVHNRKVKSGKFDLKMTLDAVLQTQIQEKLEAYASKLSKNKMRISVVVLDAKNGDLLTSANYPLPDYERMIREEELAHAEGRRYAVYSDHYKNNAWTAYTDRDLGLSYQTPPGSTAKVMSALAGLNKLGVDRARREAVFPIYRYEVIDISKNGASKEPPMGSVAKAVVSMKEAIVKSSNCYFINLVNHFDCYDDLERIYEAAGVSLEGTRSYALHFKPSDTLRGVVTHTRSDAIKQYHDYIEKRDSGMYSEPKDKKTLGRGIWMWAWGQGTMDATPLAMARVVSAVANNGKMPVTRYLLQTADKKKQAVKPEYVALSSKSNADELKLYMKAQAAEHGFPSTVGGKTGTPERVRGVLTRVYDRKAKNYVVRRSQKPEKSNDGWYIFFVETGNHDQPLLSVAIRMERVGDATSGAAMKLAKEVVFDALNNKYVFNN